MAILETAYHIVGGGIRLLPPFCTLILLNNDK